MNLFRVRGIQLAVHFSFFLLLAYRAEDGWDNGGWPGLVWGATTLIAFFTCVVLHELGHSFTAMRFGIGVRRILLMPIGGMAEMDDIPRQPVREGLITLAGPAVNFAIAGVLWGGLALAQVPDEALDGYTLPAFVDLLMFWNLLMGIFNLLPAFPMDGGRILRALLALKMPYMRATIWAVRIGKIVAGVCALLALILPPLLYRSSPAFLIVALFAFIIFAGEMELRAIRRRELEDAHWRAILARTYQTFPPVEEPPVLIR